MAQFPFYNTTALILLHDTTIALAVQGLKIETQTLSHLYIVGLKVMEDKKQENIDAYIREVKREHQAMNPIFLHHIPISFKKNKYTNRVSIEAFYNRFVKDMYEDDELHMADYKDPVSALVEMAYTSSTTNTPDETTDTKPEVKAGEDEGKKIEREYEALKYKDYDRDGRREVREGSIGDTLWIVMLGFYAMRMGLMRYKHQRHNNNLKMESHKSNIEDLYPSIYNTKQAQAHPHGQPMGFEDMLKHHAWQKQQKQRKELPPIWERTDLGDYL